jgi:hypothetical protein
MKKILILSALILSFVSCQEDDSAETTEYDIEGKWLFPSDTFGISDQGISNTMYIFENGIRYTYYCIGDDCASQYESFEAGDSNALPGTNEYTFENNVLTVDLNFGNELVTPIVFECNGGEAYFETPGYSLVRLSSGCD